MIKGNAAFLTPNEPIPLRPSAVANRSVPTISVAAAPAPKNLPLAIAVLTAEPPGVAGIAKVADIDASEAVTVDALSVPEPSATAVIPGVPDTETAFWEYPYEFRVMAVTFAGVAEKSTVMLTLDEMPLILPVGAEDEGPITPTMAPLNVTTPAVGSGAVESPLIQPP